MKPRPQHLSEQSIPDDMWKLTLSDLLTLLLAFFVLRFSTLEFDSVPVVGIPGAPIVRMQEQEAAQPETPEKFDTDSARCQTDTCRSISDRLAVTLDTTFHGGGTREFENGIAVRSKSYQTEVVFGPGSFLEGSSELAFGAVGGLNAVARAIAARPLSSRPARIDIAGFASETPESPQAAEASNWDLANARALTVTRQMLDAGIDQNLIFISGFALPSSGQDEKKDQSIWSDPRVILRIVDVPAANKPVAGQ